MDCVRIGVIGVGNMGTSHAKNIASGKVENAKLTAVCDANPARLAWFKANMPDVKVFENEDQLMDSKEVDAVVVATEHFLHPPIAIKAFEKGLHVLIEKPAGVYTLQVREMNKAAEESGKVFAIMYNQRTNPVYRKARELIKEGELGEIKRSIWIITSWYRPQSYFDSGGWRATWAGEGGGVLLNQDPHQLDLWQWICGMPKRVRSFMYFGKYHDIEVEDDVTGYVEYENGATGLFVTSTGEAPGTNRLEISGDMGKIVIEDKTLTFWRNRVNERQFNREYQGGFGQPECWKCEIPITETETGHVGILNNFVEAILTGKELIAPGVEGINGLSISNAMHLSAWLDDWVEIPFDDSLYYEKLQEKMRTSTFKKNVVDRVLNVEGTH
jgi:predicted dehydrogenase